MEEKQLLRILVVDDEKAIRRFLMASLSAHGYAVFECETGIGALEKTGTIRPDIIILDLGLPDMDGLEVLEKIRKRSKVPVIILSVREDASDKISALNAGADDYLTKPFSTGELLARIIAVMRRLLPPGADQIVRSGSVELDITRHEVKVSGSAIDLTPTEYDVLKIFMLNPGKVLSHRYILREIWNKAEEMEGVMHLLRVTISNIRAKIEPDPDRPAYILTEPCIGYRFRSEK